MSGSGSPALRHDWFWPTNPGAFVQWMLDLSTGWIPDDLGHPQPYPMTYFVTWPLAIVDLVVGSRASLALLAIVLATALLYAGNRICDAFGANGIVRVATGMFLLFNPWTYSKIVAGHLTQVLAYAGLTLVVTELTGGVPSRRRLAFAVLLTALQTQFVLIAFCLCLFRLRAQSVRQAVALGLVVFAPTILGIAFGAASLLSWSFTVAWENQQSVPPASGVLLQGYFTRYADLPFAAFGWLGVLVFAATAVLGIAAVRSRALAETAVIMIGALLVASGTMGPLGALWRWAIPNLPLVGVYRELYDLIALVAIGYGIGSAAAAARFPQLRFLTLGGAIVLAVAWLASPPSKLWVPEEALPSPGPNVWSTPRYALMPPFQPQSYLGEGAGADQLFIGTSAANVPANGLISTYPASSALADYWLHGDVSELRRLGVGLIECRSGFREIGGIYASDAAHLAGKCNEREIAIRDPAPIVALQGDPKPCSLCAPAGAGNVFVGDMAAESGTHAWIQPIAQQRVEADPSLGWIDSRIIFPEYPELGQALGGAFTTQSAVALGLEGGAPKILAAVDGTLRDERGDTVTGTTGGYRWIRLRNDPRKLSCFGRCLVVGVGDDAGIPLQSRAIDAHALSSRWLSPWMLVAHVPPKGRGVVRFIEKYDRNWMALTVPGGRPLQHVRLDATINGWRLPAGETTSQIVIVNALAVAQLFAGLIGFLVAVGVVLRFARADDTTALIGATPRSR